MSCPKILIYVICVLILFLIYKLLSKKETIETFNFVNIPANLNQSPAKGIPKIIHHICPNDYKRWHPHWFTCYWSWLVFYPKHEYTHLHWDDKELDDFITENYPWFLDVFRGYDCNIKRYDIARAFLLYHYGGIYADMDYRVFKNFYDELPQDTVSISESPYKVNEHIQNALMISPPQHTWWLIIIDECYNRRNLPVLESTGPKLLSEMYYQHPTLVNVLPAKIYNPNVHKPDKIDETQIYAKHLLSNVWV